MIVIVVEQNHELQLVVVKVVFEVVVLVVILKLVVHGNGHINTYMDHG